MRVVHGFGTLGSHRFRLGSGQLLTLGLQRQSENINVGVESQYVSSGFRRLGLSLEQPLSSSRATPSAISTMNARERPATGAYYHA